MAMNGVVSTNMRTRGVEYRLNFGLTQPLIRQLAVRYTPDAELAQQLWQEDVRECRILATMLYPPTQFTQQMAQQWAGEVRNYEMAEQLSTHLLSPQPYALELALQWVAQEDTLLVYAALQLLNRLFAAHTRLTPQQMAQLVPHLFKQVECDNTILSSVTLNAASRYITTTPEDAPFWLQLFETELPNYGESAKQMYQILADDWAYEEAQSRQL